jgi:hypothetical protein
MIWSVTLLALLGLSAIAIASKLLFLAPTKGKAFILMILNGLYFPIAVFIDKISFGGNK